MKTTSPRLNDTHFSWVCATVVAALVPNATLLPAWLLLILVALIALRWLQRRRTGAALSRWLILPLTLALVACVALAYGSIMQRASGTALLACMLVLKLLEGDRKRDALLTITLAWFLMMVTFLFDEALAKALLVAALMPIGFAALIALNSEPQSVRSKSARWQSLRQQSRAAGILLLQAIPLALIAFVFLPRLSTPLWGTPGDVIAKTGLSERMAPGSMLELLLDDSPAMRVTFTGAGPPLAQLYWRGLVLSDFDGQAWTRGSYAGTQPPGDALGPAEPGSVFEYEVIIEPSDTRWMPQLDRPLTVPQGGDMNQDLETRARLAISSVMRYEGRSSTNVALESQLAPRRQNMLQQLPTGFNPRTHELIRGWRQELGDDDQALIDRAARMFREQNFSYTFVPPLLGRDSVDDFLFNTQAGFCEHYASAFGYMMRAAGIPTRVIIGYQGGFFNQAAGYWVVRKLDAHAWNEVWLEGSGWVRVDPTQFIAPHRVFSDGGRSEQSSRFDGESLMSLVYQQWDRVGHAWRRAVLQFNAERQQAMMKRLGLDDADSNGLLILLALGMLASIGTLTWLALRSQGRSSNDPVVRLWWRWVAKLERGGLRAAGWQGPRSLGKVAARRWPEQASALETIAQSFEYLRYRDRESDPQQLQALRLGIDALRLPSETTAKGKLNTDAPAHIQRIDSVV